MISLLALFALPLASQSWLAQDTQAPIATFTGTYVVAEDSAAVQERLDAKAKVASDQFPFYAKSIAEGRLVEAMTFCKTYEIDLQADSWSNKCDSLPVLNRPIDKSVTSWQGEGDPVKTRISRKGNRVILRLQSDTGVRVNTFTFKPDGTMILKVSLASDSMETPVTWTVPYKLK